MTILGHDPQGNNIEITQTHRLNSMYVIGANGMGKTTMLENMIVEDITIGMGLAVLDPHGDLINNIIKRCPENRLDDVILFDPILLAEMGKYFGLNLFECHNMNSPKAVEFAVEQVIGIFSKVFGMSVETPRLNQYVRNIAYTFVGTGYTMVDIPPLLLDKPFRDKVLGNEAKNHLQSLFWKNYNNLRPVEQNERSESTLDRVDGLISNSIIRNIVGQSRTSINFREIMDSGKILLVSLNALHESFSALVGSIIIGQILTACLSRAGTTKRRQFNLYADEYHRYAVSSFTTLWTESRKFGLSITAAHQFRTQLDEKNAGAALQAGSLVCFRVTSEDAEKLASEFLLTPREAIQPPKTIPINVLEYIDRHPSKIIKEFTATYIEKLRSAIKVNSEWGPIYKGLEMLLFHSMLNKAINTKEYKEVIYSLGHLFGYFKVYSNSKLADDKTAPEGKKYWDFADSLYDTCCILIKEPIMATSTEQVETISQQTFADKKNELANELVHLKRGHARVKLQTGEYLLITIVPESNKKDFEAKKQRIIDNTRKMYCKPRSIVEEEIRRRQTVEEQPPSITRKHQV